MGVLAGTFLPLQDQRDYHDAGTEMLPTLAQHGTLASAIMPNRFSATTMKLAYLARSWWPDVMWTGPMPLPSSALTIA